jgi:predicted permease
MKQGGRTGESAGHRRLQSTLVVAQVAVSVVLLIGAGLLLSSFYRLSTVDPGYRAEHVISAEAYTNFSKYPDAASQIHFYEPVLQRLAAEPGVVSVAVTNAVPLSATQPGSGPFEIEGRRTDDPDRRPTADVRVVTPDYFRTLGVPLLKGRVFTDLDRTDGPPVVIVNKAMMRYWDDGDPVGSRLSFDNGQTWLTVVGVVGDIRQFGLEQPSVAQVYVPLSQSAGLAGRFLVRTSGDPLSVAKMIRDDVHAVDPDMPVENIQTLEALRDTYLATPKLTAMLLTLFAALAMIVTVAGVAGVIATSVSRRTAEFGLRMALGAGRGRVLWQVLRQGLTLVALGLAVGGAAALGLARVLRAYLFETQPADPLILAAVAVVFAAAGLAACLGPAWRATSVDPMLALRTD